MNLNRYIVPATIAAALHTAFVLAFPGGPPPIKVVPVPQPIQSDLIVEVPLPPPDAPDEAQTSVKKLPEPVDEPPPRPAPPEKIDPGTITESVDKVTLAPVRPIGNPGLGPEIPGLPTGPGTTAIFSSVDLDRTPRATAQLPPSYPYDMKQAGIAGAVLVEFVVDSSGQVSDACVVRSNQREFEEPTLRAVLRWHFEPGTRHGRKVPFRMQVPVTFALNEN
jgi:protein TonB